MCTIKTITSAIDVQRKYEDAGMLGVVALLKYLEHERIEGRFILQIGADCVSDDVPICYIPEEDYGDLGEILIGDDDNHIDPITWLDMLMLDKVDANQLELLDRVCRDLAYIDEKPGEYIDCVYCAQEELLPADYN